jgi:hypothetical protein
MQEQLNFVNSIESKTHAHQLHRAGKMTRAHEKKTKTRVYQPNEKVLIDVGKRNRVKNTREAYEATVNEGLIGGEYAVTVDEGELAGGQYLVGHERIEPMDLADPTISSANASRQTKTAPHTSNNGRGIGARGRFHGLRRVGGSKRKRSVQHGWQVERKAAVNRIGFNGNNMLINNISNNNSDQITKSSELTNRSGSHIWKLACSGQLLPTPAGQHFTRRRARRNNTN